MAGQSFMTHRIIAHHGDKTWGCSIWPQGKLARAVDFLTLEAFVAEGGEMREEGGYKTPADAIRYQVFDADGKPMDRSDDRTAAEMGLGEETHIYLLLPEESAE